MYDPREGSRRGRGGDERYGARAEGFQESFLIHEALATRVLLSRKRSRDPAAQAGAGADRRRPAQSAGRRQPCRRARDVRNTTLLFVKAPEKFLFFSIAICAQMV